MADREVPPPAVRRRRVRDFVANRSTAQRLGVVGAVLVVLTGPFGGWRSASEEGTQPLTLGQKIDIGPFYLTVEKVSQVPDLLPAVAPQEGNKLLAIKVKVTNHTDVPEYADLATSAVGGEHTGARPWPDDTEIKPRLFDVDDAVEVPKAEFINPDQTYTYVVVVEQDPDTDLDRLTVNVLGYRYEAEDPGTLYPPHWVLEPNPLVDGHVEVTVVE